MKAFLIKIGIGLILVFFGWQIANYGDKVLSKEHLQQYKDLCNNADSTFGFPKDSISILTLKMKSAKTEVYTITYKFTVSNNQYFTSINSTSITIKDSIKIWYDKKNPANNTLTNPCANLQYILENKKIGHQWPYYAIGVVLLLFGISIAWGAFKNLLKKAVTGK